MSTRVRCCLVATVLLAAILTLPRLFAQAVQVPERVIQPQWAVGETWRVKYSYFTYSFAKDGVSNAPIPREDEYSYRVGSESAHPGYPGVRTAWITAESIVGLGSWRLIIDRDRLELLQIEDLATGGRSRVYSNPFGRSSWLTATGQFPGIIHDFPAVVPSQSTITPTRSGASGYQQSVSIASGVGGGVYMQSVMKRIDPITGLEQEVSVQWNPGEPWWSRADVSLGGTVTLSGELQ